jgi:hypothetical protein
VADALRKEPGVNVQIENGARGEFTVLMDGRELVKKQGDQLPPLDEVLTAVRNAQQPTAGTQAR